MITDIQIPAKRCECDICHYSWISIATTLPECCRSLQCRSREWNGKKMVSHVNEIKLPSPRPPGRPKTITLISLDQQDEL
jgi:hypothetical protein